MAPGIERGNTVSTDPAVVTSIPQRTMILSNNNISQCIAVKASVNLTAENEVMIVYTQHKSRMISHNGSTFCPEYEELFLHSQNNYGHKRSPELATGSCSVVIEAPPGKVLSILFLNHTCSHGNKVHVQDIHDGWSTTLDGCSPWKSPGYDVTTANRSAVIVINLHNLVDFFRLKIQIKAVVVRVKDGFLTHYVSPVLGYIQTPGWHPFARPFAGTSSSIGNTINTVAVMVPSNHVTLISVVYYSCFKCIKFATVSENDGELLWWYLDPHNVLHNVTEFRVLFEEMSWIFFQGDRVLFTVHQPLFVPQRSPRDGLWNCSVPFWPDFHQHFVCNDKRECTGREDEMWCPDTSCQQGGIQHNEECYFILRLPRKKNTWHHANTACKQWGKQWGAALASFPTVNSWYHFSLLRQTVNSYNFDINIGLQSPDTSYPHMYRYSLQWFNSSISHYAKVELLFAPPTCISYWDTGLSTKSCSDGFPSDAAYALCQAMSSSVVNKSQNTIGQRKGIRGMSAKQTQFSSRGTDQGSFPFPNFPCPDLHRTHTFLACDAFSVCWLGNDVSYVDVNVTTDNDVIPDCVDLVSPSFKALFPCRNGVSFVPYSLVCNYIQDCADNSDEDFCVFSHCSGELQYKCANGQCLHVRYHCDEFVQCVDESDEIDCMSNKFDRMWVVLPRPPAVADFDGRGFMVYTPLTTTQEISAVMCPDTHVFCPGDGYCLPVYVRCNGLYDCPGQEDEVGCDNYRCPGLYRCRGLLDTCLHPDHLCDGWPQCPQHDDEVFCNLTCPVSCTCLGHAFTCTRDFHVELFSHLRYLNANGTGLKPGRLHNSQMLVYLSLANCDLAHLDNLSLPNLLSLDLSGNRFSVVTVAELKQMKNLQNLSLTGNPLSTLFSGNYSSGFLVHEDILHVDLSGVVLKALDMPSYLPFPSLISLNMSRSGVISLVGDGFQLHKSLRILDLRDCPMTAFPKRVFKDLQHLHQVFADNYKLCCEANLPQGFNLGNCKAPLNEVSSCDALLRADVYRVCLSVLAVLALSGNLGCFCLRIFSLTGRGKTGFNVFVTHLCVSDFVMGVYMAMIGVADRLYLDRYLWEEGRWRHSAACRVAGVLALLSSEVSAFIICLITLDRFLVIRFPFSRLRFSSFSAQIASFMTWTVGVIIVTLPVVPIMAYKHFYGQTGICVPLPITRNDFAGQIYAFGVMILLNLVVFLMIATGQFSVYLSMTSNAMSSIDTTRKSRDLIVARRLITVVVSDFLCWFPVGLLGVLAAQGVPVSGEINVAMAICVLPLNSALNPFLYTLNIIQEKRRRATEVKLLKLIMDHGINDTETVNKG